MKTFAIIAMLLAIPSTTALAQGDGWAHDMKPPPPEKLFKTPYDVLVYTNQAISAGDPCTVTIKSDGDGIVTIDVIFPLSRKTNPAIALMQDHYVLHGNAVGGWKVADLRARWKCRFGDTQNWQWRRDACSVKAR